MNATQRPASQALRSRLDTASARRARHEPGRDDALLAGTVYGVLLNGEAEWTQWVPQMTKPPYQATPQAPVLYVKTANTWCASGQTVALPTTAPEVEIGATLALVIGREACAVDPDRALEHVAGWVLVNDWSLPHARYYRPPVRFKNLDGFLGIGPRFASTRVLPDPHAVQLEVRLDGQAVQSVDLGAMRRRAPRLLADVSAFMTLHRGDVLLLGLGADRPRARAGQRVDIVPRDPAHARALGTLSQTIVQEAA